MCTPSDGAGPSNAMGTLADNLLGRRRKEDHLQEVRLFLDRMFVLMSVWPALLSTCFALGVLRFIDGTVLIGGRLREESRSKRRL